MSEEETQQVEEQEPQPEEAAAPAEAEPETQDKPEESGKPQESDKPQESEEAAESGGGEDKGKGEGGERKVRDLLLPSVTQLDAMLSDFAADQVCCYVKCTVITLANQLGLCIHSFLYM